MSWKGELKKSIEIQIDFNMFDTGQPEDVERSGQGGMGLLELLSKKNHSGMGPQNIHKRDDDFYLV